MPTYIMLSTLTPEGVQTVKNNPARIREVNNEVEQLGATVKAQWATLGHFDFVNVVEAPDEKTMARVSLELGSRGTAHYETLTAIPIDDFIAAALTPRVLVVGGGGREHAIVRALAALAAAARGALRARQRRDPRRGAAARRRRRRPGGARRRRGERASTSSSSGPEAPLVAGLADALRGRGRAVLRARRASRARLEGSKAFAKEVMEAAGRADRPATRSSHASRTGWRRSPRYPAVIKADGLAAGKGVVIAARRGRGARRARGDARRAALRRRTRCVVEEFLDGDELSLLALCDGERALPLAPARDFKRIGDGDTGPNTGGMGAFSPVAGDRRRAARRDRRARVHQPVRRRARAPRHAVPRRPLRRADAHRRRPAGARVQRPLRRSRRRRSCSRACAPTCSTCCMRATEPGGLAGVELEWDERAAVTVVLASRGYPASSSSRRRRSAGSTRAGGRRGHPRRHGRARRRRSSPPAAACST